ncbi:hypothetical protein EBB07_01770 [Paenibacillaceae bacterium]|nr:hypothetical protein EBB07_01770 [Paenibacillaceae bacterium]
MKAKSINLYDESYTIAHPAIISTILYEKSYTIVHPANISTILYEKSYTISSGEHFDDSV